MNIWQSIVLGLVQGATEFLPISSSGHQIIAGRIIGLSYVPLGFELLTHLATLLAVIIAMRKILFPLIRRPLQKINFLIIVATVPTVIIFFVFRGLFEQAFDGRWLAICFVITAIILFVSSLKKEKQLSKSNSVPLANNKKIGFLDAAIIGVAQGAAGMPGISRSGITIGTAKLLGQNQTDAARFSFLISIPLILGASLWQFISSGFSFGISVAPAIGGFLAAFVSGFIAITLFMKLISRFSLNGFSIYLVALAIFMLLNDLVFMLF